MQEIKRYDTVVGRIIGINARGCYVRDEATDRVVFYFGNGSRGDRVQLTVQRVNAETERVTCLLDSVLEYGAYCLVA